MDSHPIKVLIADDDVPTRILLRSAILQWGYEVIEAADGEEAWQILQKPEMPKLMIVDWLMPKLDGIDLCRRIKNELKNHPYIILLTQLSGTTNIVKGLEAGADEFLSKPFNMAELQSRLSVGKRIVHYEENLANKNAELKTYFEKAAELSAELNEVNEKVDNILNTADKSDAYTQLKQIKELKADIKKIMDRIFFLHAAHKQKSGDAG